MYALRWSLLVVVLAGCESQRSVTAADPAAPTRVRGATLYEGVGLVLDKQGDGLKLCLDGIFLSYPPQCGATESTTATSAEAFHDAHAVPPAGRRLGVARSDEDGHGRLRPCIHGGPADAGLRRRLASPLVPRVGEGNDLKKMVFVATFTGDLAAREVDLRKLWGGALCVARQKHSEAELSAIRSRAEATMRAMGMELQESDTDVTRGTIHAVTTVTTGQLAKLDREYGKLLVVTARLRPLP